jgi:hypothetical protein
MEAKPNATRKALAKVMADSEDPRDGEPVE